MSLQILQQEGVSLSGLTVLIYGLPKVGKTTTAAKFRKPLVLSCEPGGTQFLSGVAIAHISGIKELMAAKSEILGADYPTIVLDGLTYLIGRETAGYSDMRDYGKLTNQVSSFLGDMAASGKVIIATGHAREVVKDAETRIIGPDLNPALMQDIVGLFSIVLYADADASGSYVVSKPAVKTIQTGFGNRQTTIETKILAGDRSGRLPAKFKLTSLMDLLRDMARPEPSADRPPPQE